MASEPAFVHDLALVLGVAAITSLAFRRLRQPTILGYLAAGLIVGPYIPLPLFAELERIEALSEFGVILVMFSVGLEFSIRRLLRLLPIAGMAGLVQVSTMLFVGNSVGRLLGMSDVESLFLAAALAISSTMVVAKIYDERPVDPSTRRLVFGILVVQDVVAITLIAVLTAVASGGGVSASVVGDSLLNLIGVLSVMVIGGLLIVPRLMPHVRKLATPETTVVTMTGFAFAMAMLADWLEYSPALGAFVAGVLVAEAGSGHEVEVVTRPVKDFFAAVFFVAVGMSVNPKIAWDHLGLSLLLCAVVVIVQLTSVTIAGILSGNGIQRSIRAGASLGQIGEFAFIMMGIGISHGVIGAHWYPIIVTVAVLTAMLTPLLLRGADAISQRLDHVLPGGLIHSLNLYEAWFEQLRTAGTTRGAPRLRRNIIVVFLDGGAVATLLVIAGWRAEAIALWLDRTFGISHELAPQFVTAGLLALVVPFAGGVLRGARGIGRELGNIVLPPPRPEHPDLSQAPRKLFMVGLQVMVILAVGAPVIAITQPLLPSGVAAIVFVVLLAAFAVYFWRTAHDVHGHVRAAAQVVLEMLTKKEDDSASESIESVDVLPNLLSGLGHIAKVTLTPQSAADGRTLAELDLRAKTGCTVLAVQRGEGAIANPGGNERLVAGDVVVLAGATEAVEQAERLLVDAPG